MKQAAAILEQGTVRHVSREDEPLPIYSLAKPLIAAAIIESGINLNAPVNDWIDRQWLPEGSRITIEQLLLHRSGIRDYGAQPAYARAIEAGERWTDDSFADITTRKPLLFEPGQNFAYSNPGYWLLARVLQRHTGQTFEQAMQQLVFGPFELTQTKLVTGQFAEDLPDYPAEWVWHGLVISDTRDMLKFMSSDLARTLAATSQPVGDAGPPWRNAHYGYGMMIEPGIAYGHNGNGPGYSAACFQFTDRDQTICVLKQSPVDDAAFADLCELADWQNR